MPELPEIASRSPPSGPADLAAREHERALPELQLMVAETLRATASYDQARDALQQALAIFDQLGHPEAGRVRAELDSIRISQQA